MSSSVMSFCPAEFFPSDWSECVDPFSVTAALKVVFVPGRPNSFVIITANRVIHCNTELPEEMHHWISLLQKPKGDTKVEGQEFLVRGRSCILHPST